MSAPETSRAIQKGFDKGKLKIHNLMPSLERTYLAIGSTIGKYRIIEEIDRGGMAVVYKALQLDLDREVALKVLPANITINRRFVDRFLSEAHAVAKLNHPNIVSIHEVGVENNVYFLAMDYIPGVNLYYYLNFQKPKLIDVLEITARLADALAYAHRQKIVHRDLKLNNVIMRDPITPVLIDFGLAKALESEEGTITKTGEIMGSPAYMAPERLYGTGSDARSDICSVGIMLYEMLTFKNPYLDPRSIHQTTLNVIEANPIPPRKLVMWLPPEIEAITLKAMHREPARRYQTMEELALDIRRYQKGEQVLANPPSLWSKLRHLVRKRWPVLAIGALVCLFAVFYAYTQYMQSQKERPYWQLMYKKHFGGLAIGDEWSQYPGVSDKNEGWTVKNGELLSPTGPSFIRLDRSITRDARVEFDVRGVESNVYNIGFFLYGSRPDSGYGFHIYRGTDAECGVTYPGHSFLFSEYNPLALPPSKRFHVVMERKENIITFKLNDMTISKVCDFFPPIGRNHQSLGFSVNGSRCAINNIQVYRYAIPEVPSPSLIPDRFLERGDFASAIEEYRELLVDHPASPIAQNVILRIAECYLRLGQYDKVKQVLSDPLLRREDDPTLLKDLYLRGVLLNRIGRVSSADSAYLSIGNMNGADPLFAAAMSTMIFEIFDCLSHDDPGLAQNRVVFMTQNYPKFSRLLGRAHLRIMDYYTKKGALDAAIETGLAIVNLHSEDSDILSLARVNLSSLYMAKQKKNLAVDLLNQCVASYVPSEAVWQAWMELAAIYRYDANLVDAYTTYRKVYDDCPHALVTKWLARIKMGELAQFTSSEETPKAVFDDVVKSPHPFVLPRMIARYYLGMMSDDEFREFWDSMYPDDIGYQLYFASKAIQGRQMETAEMYLSSLEETLPSPSWRMMQVNNLHGVVKKLK
jgi:serine/threonine protein kinase/outer membrane protein assembly factor BamD (BamD/ComL family)